MKNRMMITAIVLGVLLTGCGKKNLEPVRVVTEVDIAYDRGYQILRRHYTNPEKVSMVLNYLRLQKDLGSPDTDPDLMLGNHMQIDVTLSDGSHRHYDQHSGLFLSEKNENWHKINPELASGFDMRLQMIPNDKNPPAV